MAEDNQQGQQDEQNQLPPSMPPISDNKGDNGINSECGSNNSPKKEKSRFYLP